MLSYNHKERQTAMADLPYQMIFGSRKFHRFSARVLRGIEMTVGIRSALGSLKHSVVCRVSSAKNLALSRKGASPMEISEGFTGESADSCSADRLG